MMAVSPPMWASTMALYLVKVERKDMVVRLEQGALPPQLGPAAKITLLASSRGLVPAGTSS